MLKTYWLAVMATVRINNSYPDSSHTHRRQKEMQTEQERESFIEICIYCVCSSAEKKISNEIRAVKLISTAKESDRE